MKCIKTKILCFCLLFLSDNTFANNTLNAVNEILSSRIILTTESFKYQGSYLINPIVYTLQKDYVFILFYKFSCLHCRRFDQVLKKFSHVTSIPVKAFTLDGDVSSSFSDVQNLTSDVVKKYFGTKASISVPTLFIMNTQNSQIFPVAIGELSYQELVERMNNLANNILVNIK